MCTFEDSPLQLLDVILIFSFVLQQTFILLLQLEALSILLRIDMSFTLFEHMLNSVHAKFGIFILMDEIASHPRVFECLFIW